VHQLRVAERQFGPVGVAGVYGVGPVLFAEGGPESCYAAEAAEGGARCEHFIPHPPSFIPLSPSLVPAEATERIGWVVDRGRMLRDGPELPARVATLDEVLLVVRRDSPLRFYPALGFHLYGADICLQAAERGLAVVAWGHCAITIGGASGCRRRFI
jgi:hypothetical protein